MQNIEEVDDNEDEIANENTIEKNNQNPPPVAQYDKNDLEQNNSQGKKNINISINNDTPPRKPR